MRIQLFSILVLFVQVVVELVMGLSYVSHLNFLWQHKVLSFYVARLYDLF